MLWLFVCLTTAGAFGAGMAWAQLRLRADEPEAPEPRPLPQPAPLKLPAASHGDILDELFALKTGDVVCHMGQDHVVGRVQTFKDADSVMVRAFVDGDAGQSILVMDTPVPFAALARPTLPQAPLRDAPDSLQHGGLRYRRVRRLELRDPARGNAVTQTHLYEGPDRVFLWLLLAQETWEVLEGRALQLADVMVLKS